MDPKVEQLLKIPQFVQRSPEWHNQRNNAITASDIPTVLGENKYKTPSMLNGVAETQLFLNKISVKQLSPNIKYMMNNLRMSICELG